MQRFAFIHSLLICTTFANTNVYNSSNGWIPLRLTEQSSKIKNVFKEATNFNNNIFKESESREEESRSYPMKVIKPQVKSSPQSNKIFFLQPDTKESSEMFASPAPRIQGVKETTIEEANNEFNDFRETSQPTMKSLFYETPSTRPATEGEMATKTVKKETDSSLENQNKTIDPRNVKQSQISEDNKFDNDLHNFYDKVLMTPVTSTEAASIKRVLKGKKSGDVETTTTVNIDSTQGYVGNVREIRKPVVVPLSPRNVVNSKIINLLMKYNSNSLPMLNNYPVTKTNFNDYTNMFNLYRPQKPSLIAIPFRYNVLNHLPVNPLLAVFLSNYGYSLKDSDNGGQISKKLYGYSNNVHNHGDPFHSEDDSDV